MTKRQQNVLILILGAVAALGPFSIDMYLPAFPAIADDLNTGISEVSLTLTSYFIGISAGQLIYGPILDRYGRKRPMLIGMGIYLLATLGCALAPSIDWLIGLRGVMALGGCAGMVASRAIIRDRFPVSELARVFSTLILVMGVAPIVAPSLGGFVIAAMGWRFVFVLLVIFAAAIIFLLIRFLDESKAADRTVSLRPWQVVLQYGKVLRNRDFLIYGIAGSLGTAAMFAYISASSFVFMDIYLFSEKDYGWIFGLNASGFILGSQVNRWILRTYSSRDVTYICTFFILLVSAAIGLASIMQGLSVSLLVTLLFFFMLFLGFVNPNTQALALEPFENNAGVASALVGSIRMFSGALASALISVFHDGTMRPMIWLILVCSLIAMVMLALKRREEKLQTSIN